MLQRIAVCYLVAAAIFLLTGWRGQAAWTIARLAAYWALMGPGGFEKGANLAQRIDGLLLDGHMWSQTRTWDPEGVLSTLPAIATTLFGILTGHLLRSARGAAEKTAWMFCGGNALLFAGIVMNAWLPINKNLWTSSYSVFMAGMALDVFAICYWLVDVKGYRQWARPFAIFGMNAIAVYVLAGAAEVLLDVVRVAGAVSVHEWVFGHVFAPLASPVNASLLWALSFVTAMFLVAYGMYRRKWFVKV